VRNARAEWCVECGMRKACNKAYQLPIDWKFSKIVALHKKGNKNEPSNYRPVSLTSIVCKIMESIIRDIIMEHFLASDYFSTQTVWVH